MQRTRVDRWARPAPLSGQRVEIQPGHSRAVVIEADGCAPYLEGAVAPGGYILSRWCKVLRGRWRDSVG